jgi:hypothetical protein
MVVSPILIRSKRALAILGAELRQLAPGTQMEDVLGRAARPDGRQQLRPHLAMKPMIQASREKLAVRDGELFGRDKSPAWAPLDAVDREIWQAAR